MRSIGRSKAACDEVGSDLRGITQCETTFWTRYRFMIGYQYKIAGKHPPTPPQPNIFL